MQVILLQDVKSLGKAGEMVKVSEGYGRNYIIPKKLGVEATAKNINDYKLKKAHEAKVAQERYEEALKFAEDMKDKSITVKIRAGQGGRVFGSVSTKEIVAAFKEQLGIEIDKKKLVVTEPMRSLGTFIIDYKVHPKVTAKLTVKVAEQD